MTIAERARFVRETLARLYPDPHIPLDHRDAFTLLVAVVLSAQSTDKKVNEVTPELFALASTPDAMFVLGEERIRSIIRPIGLSPQKARALTQLSKMLVNEYDGRVPDSFEALEQLPGVGHKTASVVMSQAFGHAAFPVDTHIHRLMWRWKLSNGSSVERTERDAKRLFPEDEWNLLHLRIIFFGREYCPARGHDPKRCPICSVIGRRSMFSRTNARTAPKSERAEQHDPRTDPTHVEKNTLIRRYIELFEGLLTEDDPERQLKIARQIARFSSEMSDEIERYEDEPIHRIRNACLPMEHWNDDTGYCALSEADIEEFVRQLETLVESSEPSWREQP